MRREGIEAEAGSLPRRNVSLPQTALFVIHATIAYVHWYRIFLRLNAHTGEAFLELSRSCSSLEKATTLQDDARRARYRPPAMSSSATPEPATPMSDDILPDATAAQKSAVTQAIPGLLDDIVVTHVLRSTWLLDPADLARLSVVSRGMRHAVAATGRKVQEMDANETARLGCKSALKRMYRRGSLFFHSSLCWHDARALLDWIRSRDSD